MPDEPDFAAVYETSSLSPRMAARLWVSALFLYDNLTDASEHVVSGMLPLVAQRYADDDFLARFVSRFRVLAGRLAEGGWANETIAQCTADELALHMVIDDAESSMADEGIEGHDWMRALPPREQDNDFEWLRDILFQDEDVLHLFNPAEDGLEDPSSESYHRQGFAYLHPRDWFKPFGVAISDN